MQIKCFKCHMPIALSRDSVFAALDFLTDEGLNHYDVRCPKCRKTNRVSLEQLHQMAPNWQRDKGETESSQS